MTETKFTPGPWERGAGGTIITQTPDDQVDIMKHKPAFDYENDNQATLDYYGGHVIAETVTAANAALMIAAPEMYAIIERMVNSDHLLYAQKVQCSALLAKARGEK